MGSLWKGGCRLSSFGKSGAVGGRASATSVKLVWASVEHLLGKPACVAEEREELSSPVRACGEPWVAPGRIVKSLFARGFLRVSMTRLAATQL